MENLHPSRTSLTVGVSLALLIAGCDAGHSPAGATGPGGAAGAIGDAGGRGGAGGIGQAAGGTAGQDPGTSRCETGAPAMSWSLTPAASQLSGMVVRKEIGTGGLETFAIVAAGGADYNLTLNVSPAAPIALGDQIDIRTAEVRAFSIYRTLEIRKDGDPVVYATDVEQPNLLPPLRLEAGDQQCSSSLTPTPLILLHKLVAYDGDQPIIIDVGQQANVGRFRVYNDSIVRYAPNAQVSDAIDTFRVVLVRVR